MRWALGAYLAVSGIHVLAQLLGHAPTADLTQLLLMPLLALALLVGTSAPRSRLVRLNLLALACSFVGDAMPRLLDGDAAFRTMLGSFLLAQLVYAIAFWPLRDGSLLRRPVLLLPYFAAAFVIVLLCAPEAGALLPTIVVYAGAIVAMAVLATGLGRLGGIGAAVFVVSDALIAVNAFGVLTLPAHGAWVMSTYLAAQLMLVLAMLGRGRVARG
ncbi:lysoplasmalogenase [Brachybacterium sp. J144]|uniref:lysoplasmalogenase n=1 Tax=Brachybacterium sp. J144 TaxID=3116487 RepID=UPI002E77E630|nr:lysoplasmalogenase [Brachybacterium sp. J144]MEE1652036.1 lysoplasmalogenase [Brachybacterium sp. J144]